MPARAPDFRPGEVLPGTKYTIVKQLGAGGMGVVYQVVKPPQIQGVLKLMSLDLAKQREFRTRFLDEVRILAQLEHPNIVRVFDYDLLTDGTPFYVMELLHGSTLRDVLGTMGTLPARVAYEVARQLLEALQCAHRNEIPVIHRDIKPENIFLHSPKHGEPVVKLIDFGVSALADRRHDGHFVGTWKYAAPEQIRGEKPSPATDLYAVGLVLYEMICGQGPFEEYESSEDLAEAHMRETPPPISDFASWVPDSIVELITAALSKDERARPRDAYAFAERLYELEWANSGQDPRDRTIEGPLSLMVHSIVKEPMPGRGRTLPGKPAPPPKALTPKMPIARIASPRAPVVRAMADQIVTLDDPLRASPSPAPAAYIPPRPALAMDTFASQQSGPRGVPRSKAPIWIVLALAFGILVVGIFALVSVGRPPASTTAAILPPPLETTPAVVTPSAAPAPSSDTIAVPAAAAPRPIASAIAKTAAPARSVAPPPPSSVPSVASASPPIAAPPPSATPAAPSQPAPTPSSTWHREDYARGL